MTDLSAPVLPADAHTPITFAQTDGGWAVVDQRGALLVFARDGRFVKKVTIVSGFTAQATLISLGAEVLVGLGKGSLCDAQTGKRLRTLGGHGRGELSGAARVGDTLVTSAWINSNVAGNDVRVWDLQGEKLATIKLPSGVRKKECQAKGLALAPDGRTLFALGRSAMSADKPDDGGFVWYVHALDLETGTATIRITLPETESGEARVSWIMATATEILVRTPVALLRFGHDGTSHGEAPFVHRPAIDAEGHLVCAGIIDALGHERPHLARFDASSMALLDATPLEPGAYFHTICVAEGRVFASSTHGGTSRITELAGPH